MTASAQEQAETRCLVVRHVLQDTTHAVQQHEAGCVSKLRPPLELSPAPCCHTPQSTAHLLFGRRRHEIVLGVRQAHHHGLHPVLAPARQDAEEVDAKCARQLPSPSHQVELLQQSQVEARTPYEVLQAPPALACTHAGTRVRHSMIQCCWRAASPLAGGGLAMLLQSAWQALPAQAAA